MLSAKKKHYSSRRYGICYFLKSKSYMWNALKRGWWTPLLLGTSYSNCVGSGAHYISASNQDKTRWQGRKPHLGRGGFLVIVKSYLSPLQLGWVRIEICGYTSFLWIGRVIIKLSGYINLHPHSEKLDGHASSCQEGRVTTSSNGHAGSSPRKRPKKYNINDTSIY